VDSTNASRLRAAREIQGKSLRDIERETGIDRGTISRIERGKLRPSLPHLIALGRALEIRDLVEVLGRFYP
jgi:transcriptional regulator with XRE-family HTH domain